MTRQQHPAEKFESEICFLQGLCRVVDGSDALKLLKVIDILKAISNSFPRNSANFSDVISDGGLDPRDRSGDRQ